MQDEVERLERELLSAEEREKRVRVADGRAENHGDFSWARLKAELHPRGKPLLHRQWMNGGGSVRGWNFRRARSCHVAHGG